MRTVPSRWAFACVALVLIASVGAGQEKTPFARRNPVTEAVQSTKAAIVTVKVPRPGGGKDMIGTGVLVDGRGMIVTNNHVFGSCKHPKVVVHDGTEASADVRFAEARWDLAALRIHTDEELQAFTLTKTDDALKAGDEIRAVGERIVVNAFDVERSLWDAKPGDKVKPNVQRQGKLLVVELTLGASAGAGLTASAPAAEPQPAVQAPTARIVGVSER